MTFKKFKIQHLFLVVLPDFKWSFLMKKKLPCSWSQSRIRFLSFHNREGSNPPTNLTSKYTTWFQCQQDAYKISNGRLRNVETMSCVYWAIIYQSSHFIASLHQSSLPGVNLLFFKKQQPELLYKKGVLKDFANFTRKQLCWSLFLLRQEISTPCHGHSRNYWVYLAKKRKIGVLQWIFGK